MTPLDPLDQALITRARQLAIRAHEGQTRWGGEPFIVHPAAVASTFIDGYPAEYQIVSWLHDIVEDTEVTLEHLASHGFPPSVIEAIQALTHWPDEPYDQYIQRIGQASELAIRVKLADLEHNLSTSTDKQAKNKRIIWKLSRLYLQDQLRMKGLTP